MRVSAPPFVGACYYGTDIDDPAALIANKLTITEIAAQIGVDSLGYLSVENVKLLTGEDTGFCTACFGGRGRSRRSPSRVNDSRLRFSATCAIPAFPGAQ